MKLRLAHLSDFHLLEDDHRLRDRRGRTRLRYLNLFRALDAQERRERARRALEAARVAAVDHLAITGDVTEDGAPAQFEILAELLWESAIAPDRITLVPGNHDAYTAPGAWARALEGPLRPYALTSAPGSIVVLPGVSLVPISTAIHQSFLRSGGSIAPGELELLARLAADPRLGAQPLVVLQHHPPARNGFPPAQWVDGLREHRAMVELLDRHPHVHVLHGHTHRALGGSLRDGSPARVYAAAAVVDSEAALRIYDLSSGEIRPEPRQRPEAPHLLPSDATQAARPRPRAAFP